MFIIILSSVWLKFSLPLKKFLSYIITFSPFLAYFRWRHHQQGGIFHFFRGFPLFFMKNFSRFRDGASVRKPIGLLPKSPIRIFLHVIPAVWEKQNHRERPVAFGTGVKRFFPNPAVGTNSCAASGTGRFGKFKKNLAGLPGECTVVCAVICGVISCPQINKMNKANVHRNHNKKCIHKNILSLTV
ncbi:MAG: hypothetical protein MJ016_01175 [Victivallaceae bacterium]|nr:hypothetical protein [Victivallaceae bacterium]